MRSYSHRGTDSLTGCWGKGCRELRAWFWWMSLNWKSWIFWKNAHQYIVPEGFIWLSPWHNPERKTHRCTQSCAHMHLVPKLVLSERMVLSLLWLAVNTCQSLFTCTLGQSEGEMERSLKRKWKEKSTEERRVHCVKVKSNYFDRGLTRAYSFAVALFEPGVVRGNEVESQFLY